VNALESSPIDLSFLSTSTTFQMVERYGKAVANNRLVVDYLANKLDREEYEWGTVNPLTDKLYERMNTCASWLTFREYPERDKTILKSAKFCSKPLLCQACAIRRGSNLLGSYVPRIEHILNENPNLKASMLTFTVKNGLDLRERHNHLKDSISRLLDKRKGFLKGNKRYAYTEMVKVHGGVFAFEEPKSKDGSSWHPHIHMLILSESDIEVGFVDPDTGKGHGLRKEWFELTGDSYQVDVSSNDDQSVISLACEVMKYAVKFSDQDPEHTWEAFQVLNRQRLIRSFGSLFGVKVPKSMVDAPLSGPYIDRMFSYVGNSHYEQVSETDNTDTYDSPTDAGDSAARQATKPATDGESFCLELRKKRFFTSLSDNKNSVYFSLRNRNRNCMVFSLPPP